MLFLEHVSLFVGSKQLLNDISLSINRGDRMGVVGRNGTGKSHLMQLLSGDVTPDSGRRSSTGQPNILLVKQELPNETQTPLEFLRDNDPELQALEDELSSVDESCYGDIYSQIAEIEEERYEQLAPQVLMGLGLTQAELTQPMRQLSGGLRMRIGMATALIRKPDVLLLDEPTNHLDLESTQWLITYLKQYPPSCAFVIITHDVKLLMEVCTSTLHLRAGTLTQFEGNYSSYLQQLETTERKAAQSNADLQKQITRHKDIYYRFRDLPESRAAQAVAQLKKAEKLEDRLVDLVIEEPVIPLSFGEPHPLPDPIIAMTAMNLGYHDKVILRDVNLSIQYGARIGLLGRNGQGKSTLVKLLADKIRPLAGDVVRCLRLNIGYFSQDLTEELNVSLTVYQQFSQKTGVTNDAEIRAHLGRYGFSYDKINTLIEHLSGGEKSRLLFCLICAQSPGLIILDEPTNHLDVETRESLVLAMQQFPGAIILVSHDWTLHEQTMRNFWFVNEGRVQAYTKGLSHYQQTLTSFITLGSHAPSKTSGKKSAAAASEEPVVFHVVNASRSSSKKAVATPPRATASASVLQAASSRLFADSGSKKGTNSTKNKTKATPKLA